MRKSDINLQFKKAWELINKSQKIFLTTHEGTDGDDLGSLLAMKKVLEHQNKSVRAGVIKGVPMTLRFLPGSQSVADHYIEGSYDLAITFGCAKIERPAMPQLKITGVPIINFDHHPDNSNFGTVNVVDPATAAVAELVYYFLKYKDIAIDHDVATCILTGIFTDTGGFKHANTSAEVLEVAAQLLKKGARIDRIAAFTYGQKRPQTIRAWSKALENTRFDSQQKMVFSILTEQDLEEMGASEDDLQGFVELLNHIPQAKFALLLRQDGEVVKGSLRSEVQKGVDVSEIAHSFGGGGHKLAAGFKVKGKLIKSGNAWEIK
jgi:phosphoesterase RecJ-like protein